MVTEKISSKCNGKGTHMTSEPYTERPLQVLHVRGLRRERFQFASYVAADLFLVYST